MTSNQNDLPLTWRSEELGNNDFVSFCNKNISEIESLLLKHGAILFKGFEVDSTEKLQRCVDVLPGNSLNYIDGNSPRTKLTNAVYTSTEHPPELFISLHSELSYTNAWPAQLYFCCEIAPGEGGSTLVADNRTILASLPDEIVETFKRKGVKYIRNLHNGSGVMIGGSWQKTFETDDRAEVEEHCRKGDIEYQWNSDGGLQLIQTRPAVVQHPTTNELVWFNQADQFHPSTNPPDVYEAIMEIFSDPFDMPQSACFGDNSPIDNDMLDVIRKTTELHTIYFPWEVGDLLVIDNMLASHGRSPFSGDRRILVAMSA